MHLLFIIIVIAIIYVLQKRLYHRYWKRGLKTSLTFDREYMECGEEAELAIEIVNDKALPLPVFHFKFSVDRALRFSDMENSVVTDFYHRNDVFSILGYQKIRRNLSFRSTERGFFRVENVNVMVRDFFMSSTFAESRKEDQGIYVFPEKLDQVKVEQLVRGKVGEIAAKRSLIEDPLTFRGLRDYQQGDPYRSINMKQSARTGEWKVNLREPTEDAEVRILLNLDTDNMIRTDRLLEEAISLASTLARVYLAKKERVSLWSNGLGAGQSKLTVPGSGAELSHGITLDKYLSEIRESEGKDAFLDRLVRERENLRLNVLYIVISPYCKEDMQGELDRFKEQDGAVICIVPHYRSRRLSVHREDVTGWEVDDYED